MTGGRRGRIAFVSAMGGYPWGGSEVLWSRTAAAALADGRAVGVHVYEGSLGHPALAALAAGGASVHGRPRAASRALLGRVSRRIAAAVPGGARRRPAWLRTLAAFRPDVVCVSQGSTYELFDDAALVEQLGSAGVPFVIVCQLNSEFHLPSESLRAAARALFSRAERVVFVAEGNRALAERQLAMRLGNAAVVDNPLNVEGFDGEPYPLAQRPILASVARLDVRYKGQDVLFAVLGGGEWPGREWECRLYGEGPDRAHLERLALHCGIAGRVRFMGQVADVRRIWRECQLLVLPSRAEGTPLALMEAAVCGRAAVATDVGGCATWVAEGGGFLAEAATPRSFGAALERAWAGRGRWQGTGELARRHALARIDRHPAQTLLGILDGPAEAS